MTEKRGQESGKWTGRNDRATAEDYTQPQGVLPSQRRDLGPGILMSDLRPPKLREN